MFFVSIPHAIYCSHQLKSAHLTQHIEDLSDESIAEEIRMSKGFSELSGQIYNNMLQEPKILDHKGKALNLAGPYQSLQFAHAQIVGALKALQKCRAECAKMREELRLLKAGKPQVAVASASGAAAAAIGNKPIAPHGGPVIIDEEPAGVNLEDEELKLALALSAQEQEARSREELRLAKARRPQTAVAVGSGAAAAVALVSRSSRIPGGLLAQKLSKSTASVKPHAGSKK